MKKVLTIAGSDCSGGAGIQADIKTITVHKMYAMSVITALTAQNTTGVFGITDITPDFVKKQIDCVFMDIFPDAVKIGMISNSEIIKVIVERLKYYNARNIIIDPVMVSTSGYNLISDEAQSTLINHLLPIGTLSTPNIPEAEILCGFDIKNEEDMIKAGNLIFNRTNAAVLIKGGHLINKASDYLYEKSNYYWYSSERIDNPNTHGTGCTLSTAIACNLADGKSLDESVKCAKEYVTGTIKAGLNIGKGAGPLNHVFAL